MPEQPQFVKIGGKLIPVQGNKIVYQGNKPVSYTPLRKDQPLQRLQQKARSNPLASIRSELEPDAQLKGAMESLPWLLPGAGKAFEGLEAPLTYGMKRGLGGIAERSPMLQRVRPMIPSVSGGSPAPTDDDIVRLLHESATSQKMGNWPPHPEELEHFVKRFKSIYKRYQLTKKVPDDPFEIADNVLQPWNAISNLDPEVRAPIAKMLREIEEGEEFPPISGGSQGPDSFDRFLSNASKVKIDPAEDAKVKAFAQAQKELAPGEQLFRKLNPKLQAQIRARGREIEAETAAKKLPPVSGGSQEPPDDTALFHQAFNELFPGKTVAEIPRSQLSKVMLRAQELKSEWGGAAMKIGGSPTGTTNLVDKVRQTNPDSTIRDFWNMLKAKSSDFATSDFSSPQAPYPNPPSPGANITVGADARNISTPELLDRIIAEGEKRGKKEP